MEARRSMLVTVLTLCLFISAACGEGLIAHWNLDETSGTIAADSSGNGYDGILHGGLSFENDSVPGPSGGALHFDGANDYINVPTLSAPRGPLTIALWFRPDRNLDASSNRMELLHWADPVQRPHLTFNHLQDGEIILYVRLDGEGYEDVRATRDSWTALTWYHMAITFDGTDFKLYLNGQLDVTAAHPGMLDPTSNLYIGRHRISAFYWDGAIDDVRIYDSALSPEEVWQLYNVRPQVAVDIKPGSCPNPLNLAGRGVLPVAVLGTEDFDVNSIDIASIRLEGLPALRSGLEDVATPVTDGNECDCIAQGPDGHTDLTLKFKTARIAEILDAQIEDLAAGDVVELLLTGTLKDGTAIEARDCVVIVGKVPPARQAKRSDINNDGIINTLDLAKITKFWLQPADLAD